MTEMQTPFNTDSTNPKVLLALQKVQAVIAAKQARRLEQQLAARLCARFVLQECPELRRALAEGTRVTSLAEAVTVWIGRQAAAPLTALTEDVIESYATLLRRKLWQLEDPDGVISP